MLSSSLSAAATRLRSHNCCVCVQGFDETADANMMPKTIQSIECFWSVADRQHAAMVSAETKLVASTSALERLGEAVRTLEGVRLGSLWAGEFPTKKRSTAGHIRNTPEGPWVVKCLRRHGNLHPHFAFYLDTVPETTSNLPRPESLPQHVVMIPTVMRNCTESCKSEISAPLLPAGREARNLLARLGKNF